ncbi:MAG: RsmB/NOP family class I SAM-dependent RNA methyltransferase [Haliscomenobacteraceae bacterium CHB4]|nr:Ribosomal RNA small subunit methyltransferase B [Saprospiraceae bacterium]MCE7925645.1 RsmB/NOP family class I SAM-dependent RNA methyltransferase [Haliscomenobacteraceae bacterium CHB4]
MQPNATKLHPLLVRAVAQTLYAIFRENRHADKVIEYTLKQNPKAGSRDRAFIAETTYEVVRHYRLYTEILGKTPLSETDFWEIIGIHLLVPAASAAETVMRTLPDWKEFKNLNPKTVLEKATTLRTERKFCESIPDWLDELGSNELRDQWDATIAALNQPARVVLRANRLKTDRAALQNALRQEGVETQPIGDGDALLLTRRQNVFQTRSFKNGLFEVQDYSSQQVALLLAPEPGMRVVDACAGGGGKTLHLAALMQNRGSLIALDTHAWKLDELRLRARRAGATNIETRPIESRKNIKRLYGSADRLLLDVPCSGLGVLRRNPDAKWKLTPKAIDNLRNVQQDILQSYSPMIKPGGRMVYATCSILPSENQEQVEKFLASEAGRAFKLLNEKRILPQGEGFDGFYIALLSRFPADFTTDKSVG